MSHREAWINARQIYIAATVWAMVVGGLMAAGAKLLAIESGDVASIGLLGAFGAAGFVIWFSARESGRRRS